MFPAVPAEMPGVETEREQEMTPMHTDEVNGVDEDADAAAAAENANLEETGLRNKGPAIMEAIDDKIALPENNEDESLAEDDVMDGGNDEIIEVNDVIPDPPDEVIDVESIDENNEPPPLLDRNNDHDSSGSDSDDSKDEGSEPRR